MGRELEVLPPAKDFLKVGKGDEESRSQQEVGTLVCTHCARAVRRNMLSRCATQRQEQIHEPYRESAYGDADCHSTVGYLISHPSP